MLGPSENSLRGGEVGGARGSPPTLMDPSLTARLAAF